MHAIVDVHVFNLCQGICIPAISLKVLSRSTSAAMYFYSISGSGATQTFMVFLDRFFDMLNV